MSEEAKTAIYRDEWRRYKKAYEELQGKIEAFCGYIEANISRDKKIRSRINWARVNAEDLINEFYRVFGEQQIKQKEVAECNYGRKGVYHIEGRFPMIECWKFDRIIPLVKCKQCVLFGEQTVPEKDRGKQP